MFAHFSKPLYLFPISIAQSKEVREMKCITTMSHSCDAFHLASSGVVVNTFSSIPATDRNPLWDCIRKGVWCKTLLNQRNDNKSAVLGDVCDFLHLFFLFWGVKVSNGLEWTDSETDSGKKRTAHLEIIEAASWLTWASLVYCSVKSSFSLWSSEIRLKVVPPPSPSSTQPSYCLHMPLHHPIVTPLLFG